MAVTGGIRDRLRQRGVPHDKIALIPNGANTDLFTYQPQAGRALAQELGLEGKFIALYAGIHGVAQRLETVLHAADLLRDNEEIQFVFVGEGPRKAALMEMSHALEQRNVRFLPETPSEQMPAYLSAAACSIVPLRDGPLFRGALPSKLFEAWSCSRPVVLSVAGEAEAVLREANGGISVTPEDPGEMARAIEHLYEHREEAEAMGKSGRAYVEQRYARREQARKLEALLKEAVGM